ncbi:MAG: circularly permuted type 2 ATP-grasp protein [Candidatus Hydrogenedentes bacterium]|nr:circularly permuted type 2 ATP-grasp protein [Candidatus Hydrogenedentota bacterium]
MYQSQMSQANPPSGTLHDLLSNYSTVAGPNDELLDPQGTVRPHWQWITESLGSLNAGGLAECRRQAEEMVRQHGVVYNVYSDAKGMDRPWALDMLPVVLPAAEWAHIERGVKQRLHLMNAMLRDLYGPQKLLADGVLPHAFTQANPKFHRACHGIAPSRHGHIARYAVDLVRSPDGQWKVYSDRTQAPSGAGYALENRIVMAQTFPNLFSEGRVERLADFFESFRNTLRAMAPGNTPDPTVVLHTPGPFNEVYFEHVYLARYLGVTLLEGADLTVRDNHVYLKTIEGLKRVDVLLRRIDDEFSDPLELRKDSTLGIAGLLQAVRSGNVAVCNAVGSGLLEVPALSSVLPDVARRTAGEDLILDSVPSRWGAREEDRAWMEANFDGLRLMPAFGGMYETPVSGQMQAPDRAALRAHWRERPYDWVHVDPVVPSTVPVFANDQLVANNLVLRVYAIGGDTADSIRVLPGGLARFSTRGDVFDISMQQGCGSKDVWVLAETETSFRSLLQDRGTPLTIRRSPSNLSSRLAENLLWLGRYCERAEATVRYLRHLLARCADEKGYRGMGELRELLRAAPMGLFTEHAGAQLSAAWSRHSGEVGDTYEWLRSLDRVQDVVFDAIFNGEQPDTVASNISAIRRTAWVVRERFSEDDWRILNSFTLEFMQLKDRSLRPGLGEVLYALNNLIRGFAALSGLLRENMTRESGQVFLDLGLRLERVNHTAHVVVQTLERTSDHEEALLQSLLSICDSPMTYRARYGSVFQAAPVIDLLVCDDTNPRSVAYQVHRIIKHIKWLPASRGSGLFNEEERIIERLNTEIRTADANRLARPARDGERRALLALLVRFQRELPRFADLLEQRYFIHTAPARPLDDFR